MPRFLKWVFRPAVLIGVSIALVGTAILIVFQSESGQSKPQPGVVRAGEQEIAFLYPATSSTSWERFVAAVDHARDRLQQVHPGLEVVRDTNPESEGTLAVPEVALRWPGAPGRLVFRWYKLTSDWTTEAWVDALLARKPPPLAIIGGNNTYWARELALQLARASSELPERDRPLLLLTTATADKVRLGDASSGDGEDAVDPRLLDDRERAPGIALTSLYPGRTFRFSFTNRQMATAVTRFIWSRPELRPDADPAYVVKWTDDAYSRDLYAGYLHVLGRRGMDDFALRGAYVGQASGGIALGLPPLALAGWNLHVLCKYQYVGAFFPPLLIDSSAGSFSVPNTYESREVQRLVRMIQGVDDFGVRLPPASDGSEDDRGINTPRQQRPLLVITGQAAPSRRFLRELTRLAPITARRFVVAMGDTVSFNSIYRDRRISWPILDLPFATVFFCHRNPISSSAGFQALQPASSVTGTEDLLLFSDIVQSVGLAFSKDGSACRDARQLSQGLSVIRFADGQPTLKAEGVLLFREGGQRHSSTGESVVYLQPRFQNDRVLLEAGIEVWCRETLDGQGTHWSAYGNPLTISYDEEKLHGDRSHGGD